MAAEPKFEGWLGKGPESAKGKMEWGAFPNPKKWTEDDVDIQITHCGICGSDLHTLSSGWGPTPYRRSHCHNDFDIPGADNAFQHAALVTRLSARPLALART